MISDVPENLEYETLEEIGNGVYGTVYKGRDRAGGFVTMKKVKVLQSESGIPPTALHEIAVLKTLGQHPHPNVIRLLDVVLGPRSDDQMFLSLFLVFEHIENNLGSYIEHCPRPGIPVEIIKKLMKQILAGVDFLHCNRVVHRDIKPQNILMSNDFKIKIADFELSKMCNIDRTLNSVVATLWYGAPELILNLSYSYTADVWSCGCIMAELYKLIPLFFGLCKVEQMDNVFRVIGLPSESDWPSDSSIPRTTFAPHLPVSLKDLIPEICVFGEDLLKRMLVFDGEKRYTAFKALKHPYFVGVEEHINLFDSSF